MASYINSNIKENTAIKLNTDIIDEKSEKIKINIDHLVSHVNNNFIFISEDKFQSLIKKKEYNYLKTFIKHVLAINNTHNNVPNNQLPHIPLSIFTIVNSYLNFKLDYTNRKLHDSIQLYNIFTMFPTMKIELAIYFYLNGMNPVFLFLSLNEIPPIYIKEDYEFINYYFIFMTKLILFGFDYKTIEYANKLLPYMNYKRAVLIDELNTNAITFSSLPQVEFKDSILSVSHDIIYNIKSDFDKYIISLNTKQKKKGFVIYSSFIKPINDTINDVLLNNQKLDDNQSIDNHNYFNKLYNDTNKNSCDCCTNNTNTCMCNKYDTNYLTTETDDISSATNDIDDIKLYDQPSDNIEHFSIHEEYQNYDDC